MMIRRYSHKYLNCCLLLTAAILIPGSAAAQVAISAGVSEIYDDNIFLENDKAPAIVDLPAGSPQVVLSDKNDGDPDEDSITNVFLGMSTKLDYSKYVDGAFDGRIGGFFFADNSDEDRFTLDTLLAFEATEGFLLC